MTKRWCTNKTLPHFDKKTHASKEMIVVMKCKRVFFTYAFKMCWGNGEQTIHIYDGIVPYDFYKDLKYWAYADTFFTEEINDKDTN